MKLLVKLILLLSLPINGSGFINNTPYKASFKLWTSITTGKTIEMPPYSKFATKDNLVIYKHNHHQK